MLRYNKILDVISNSMNIPYALYFLYVAYLLHHIPMNLPNNFQRDYFDCCINSSTKKQFHYKSVN